MQLFHHTPAHVEARRVPAADRPAHQTQGTTTPVGGFGDALARSRQQAGRANGNGSENDRARHVDRPPLKSDQSKASQSVEADDEALDDAPAPAPAPASAPAPDSESVSVSAVAGADEADPDLAKLHTMVERLVQQTADESADGSSADEADQLAAMLMTALQTDDMSPAKWNSTQAPEELARMLSQLAGQGAQIGKDRLAALSALMQPMQKGQQSGLRFDLADFVNQADNTSEASGSAGQKGGQSFQAMPWFAQPASTGADVGSSGSNKATALDAMLAQLATAASASQGPGNAGGESLAATLQSGPQGLGNTLVNTLGSGAGSASGTASPSGMSEADAQMNAARLARAMSGALNQGGGTLTVRMTPPEMGTVRIQLQVQAGTVNAAMHAETDAARSLLSQQLAQLRQSLEGQGLQVDRLSVQSMNNSSASGHAGQQGNADGSPNDGRSRDEYSDGNPRQGGRHQKNASQQERDEAFERALNEMG